MSDDRLNPLDAAFLEVESETAQLHVGWAALFALPRTGAKPKRRQGVGAPDRAAGAQRAWSCPVLEAT
jgi:hypothetical protein